MIFIKQISFFMGLSFIFLTFLLRMMFGFWMSLMFLPLLLGIVMLFAFMVLNFKEIKFWFFFNKDKRGALGALSLLILIVFFATNILISYDGSSPNVERSEGLQPAIDSTDARKSVYFVRGYGERHITDKSNIGLSRLMWYLKQDGVDVLEIYLDNMPEIPEEAGLLAFIGINREIPRGHLSLIKNYVSGGGKLLFAVDPENSKKLSFLSELGVSINTKELLDPTSEFGEKMYTSVSVEDNQFNQFYKTNDATFVFPGVGSLNYLSALISKISPLLKSKLSNEFVSFIGQLKLKPAVYYPKNFLNIAIVGDSDFLVNHYLDVQYNRDFGLHLFRSLLYDDINDKPKLKAHFNDRLHLSASQRLSFLASLLLMPFTLFLLGLYQFYKSNERRKYVKENSN